MTQPTDRIRFAATREEFQTLVRIAQRYEALCEELGTARPVRADLLMDLEAVHSNGCALDLFALLAAKASDFTHDLGGIQRHLDRTTGRLSSGFRPRHARAASKVIVDRGADRRAFTREAYRWPETDRRQAERREIG